MCFLCDKGVFYTPKEMRYWRMKFPKKKMTALNNTLFVDQTHFKILNEKIIVNKAKLKNKYNITQSKIFISCHRFTNPNRRHDLLEKVIAKSDKTKVGFIIIGDGYLKPDFYLQFGWLDLSIVEAFAYGKPVITMRRVKELKHSVEYY